MDEAGYDLKNYGMQTLVVEGARPPADYFTLSVSNYTHTSSKFGQGL